MNIQAETSDIGSVLIWPKTSETESDTVADMNPKEFDSDLKERLDYARLRMLYSERQSSKYHSRYFRLRAFIGSCSFFGIVLAGFNLTREAGAIIAAVSAMITIQLLPFLKWDETVQAFKDEEKDWKRVLKSYQDVSTNRKTYNLEEILALDKNKGEQIQYETEFNDKKLRRDEKCWEECKLELAAMDKKII